MPVDYRADPHQPVKATPAENGIFSISSASAIRSQTCFTFPDTTFRLIIMANCEPQPSEHGTKPPRFRLCEQPLASKTATLYGAPKVYA